MGDIIREISDDFDAVKDFILGNATINGTKEDNLPPMNFTEEEEKFFNDEEFLHPSGSSTIDPFFSDDYSPFSTINPFIHDSDSCTVSYTHLKLPTNREV